MARGCDEIIEEVASGAASGRKKRVRLDALLGRLQPGDSVVVVRGDRLARSLQDYLDIRRRITAAGAVLDDGSDATPAGQLTGHVLASVAEFERSLIVQRTKEGLAAQRAHGRVGGNPGLRARDPAAIAKAAAGRREAYRDRVEASLPAWGSAVRQLRPQHSWKAVVAHLNALTTTVTSVSGSDQSPAESTVTVARLISAARHMVAVGLLPAEVLGRAPRKKRREQALAQAAARRLVATVVAASPGLSTRAIAAALTAAGQPAPRGTRWAHSTVAKILAELRKDKV
jgi:DNA invertase Pin-like site-specific DNA recombinase